MGTKIYKLATLLFLHLINTSAVYAQQNTNFSLTPEPLFIENKGQVVNQFGEKRGDVKFIYSSPGFNLSLKEHGFSYEFLSKEEGCIFSESGENPRGTGRPGKIEASRIDIDFIGANTPEIIASGKSKDYQNYYLAHTPEEGIRQVHGFKNLTFRNIYNNIDIIFYAQSGSVKYDVVVHPGGNLDDVRLKYNGVDKLSLKDGMLFSATGIGEIRESIPASFLAEDKSIMEVGFSLSANTLSFNCQEYNKSKTLVVDPQIIWGTYYGDTTNLNTTGSSIAARGNSVYVLGYTSGISGIATSGAYQNTFAGGAWDVYITKFNTNGIRQWGTYYGGSDWDEGSKICLDDNNAIYIAGTTSSTSGIATTGAFQTVFGGSGSWSGDAFVARFNDSGFREWATYYGGSSDERGVGVTVGPSGEVFLSGLTRSASGIASPGSHQSAKVGASWDMDGFIVKFSSAGNREWGTYYGGTGSDEARGICSDNNGNIYFTGYTQSSSGIATQGTQQPAFAGFSDAFLVKFDGSGTRQWGTYFGGPSQDEGIAICMDDAGGIYISGYAQSSSGIASAGAHQQVLGGWQDAFLAKYNSNGFREWATYYGGSSDEDGASISADSNGNIYLIGTTSSPTGIATAGVHQDTLGGGSNINAFLVKFNNSGQRQWGTYYGGAYEDYGYGVAAGQNGSVYVTGRAYSPSAIATPGAHQTSYAGAYFARFSDNPCAFSAYIQGPASICYGDTSAFNTNMGTNYSYFWTVMGGTIISGQGTGSIMVSWDSAGIASVKVEIGFAANCEDSIRFPVTILPLPDAGFSYSIDNFSAQFSPQSASHTAYAWSFGDGNFSTDISPAHTYAQEGRFYVELMVTGMGGCISVSTDSLQIEITGISGEETSGPHWRAFQTKERNLVLLYNVKEPAQVDISIMDLSGKVVFIERKGIIGSGRQLINTQTFAEGVYLLKVSEMNKKQIMLKFVK
jgi:hypothetical protein